MQITINGEQADALALLFAQQAARVDDGETLGSVTFTRQGLDASIVVAFPSDGHTFEISAGGTVDEIGVDFGEISEDQSPEVIAAQVEAEYERVADFEPSPDPDWMNP